MTQENTDRAQAVKLTRPCTTPDGDVVLTGTRGLVIGVNWYDKRHKLSVPNMIVVVEHYIYPDTGQACVGRGLRVDVSPANLEAIDGPTPTLRQRLHGDVANHVEHLGDE